MKPYSLDTISAILSSKNITTMGAREGHKNQEIINMPIVPKNFINRADVNKLSEDINKARNSRIAAKVIKIILTSSKAKSGDNNVIKLRFKDS
jgi:hypothetical protein